MRYIYENREGEQEEFSQSLCEGVASRGGYTLIGHKVGGKFYSVDQGRKVRLAQSQALDDLLDKKIWSVDEKTQLNMWGII